MQKIMKFILAMVVLPTLWTIGLIIKTFCEQKERKKILTKTEEQTEEEKMVNFD